MLIVSHYMTAFPKISRRARDKYHKLEDDMMVKNMFNSGKHKDRVGMKILNIIQLSLAGQKSHDEVEAKQNVQKVEEHLIAEEIEKLVEGTEKVENVEVDSSTLRQNDTQNDPGTRLEPRSNKESPKVEITTKVQPVNINEEEEESAEDDYEFKRREKGKNVEESRNIPSPTIIRSSKIHSTLISLNTEKLQEFTVNDPLPLSLTPSSSSPKFKLSATNRLLSLFKPKTGCFKRYTSFFDEFQSLPKMVDDRVKELTKTYVPVYVAQGLIMERQQSQADVAKMIADAICNTPIFDIAAEANLGYYFMDQQT
ncbi:hypothetical protein Tco_1470749 [Tanacetum coccineum]